MNSMERKRKAKMSINDQRKKKRKTKNDDSKILINKTIIKKKKKRKEYTSAGRFLPTTVDRNRRDNYYIYVTRDDGQSTPNPLSPQRHTTPLRLAGASVHFVFTWFFRIYRLAAVELIF